MQRTKILVRALTWGLLDCSQTAGVGQKLTISTSALIASSLCGAVHSAGVPYSQPSGTGLCYSASAGAVQKAAGACCVFVSCLIGTCLLLRCLA